MALSGFSRVRTCFHFSRFLAPVSFNAKSYELPPNAIFTRTLFHPTKLGLEGFVRYRDIIKTRMGNHSGRFKERMVEYMQISEKNTVYATDLKTMMHLADTEEELRTTIQLFKRFCQQELSNLKSDFQFGPILMRLCHHLQQPNIALELVKDEEFSSRFLQMSSMLVLLDLLYEHKMYNQVFDLFDKFGEKTLRIKSHQLYTFDAQLLLGTTAWKLNTPEALTKVTNVMEEILKAKSEPATRFVCCMCVLAINQGKPEVASDLLDRMNIRPTVALMNTKVLLYATMGQVDRALNILQLEMERRVALMSPSQRLPFVCQNVMDELGKAAEKTGSEEMQKAYKRIAEEIVNSNSVMNRDLDDLLNAVIFAKRTPQDGYLRRKERRQTEPPKPAGLSIPSF